MRNNTTGSTAVFAALACLAAGPAFAQTYAELHVFAGGADGLRPNGVTYIEGKLYGTTANGGDTACGGTGCGTAFSVNVTSGLEVVLHRFTSRIEGQEPSSGLTLMGNTVYGGTAIGGPLNHGVLFGFDLTTGTKAVVCSFPLGGGGSDPTGNLAPLNQVFYGTTHLGGLAKAGTVFVCDPVAKVASIVTSFPNRKAGRLPDYGVVASGLYLYGVANFGLHEVGSVFKTDPVLKTTTDLFDFSTTSIYGDTPNTPLIYGGSGGLLYGTAQHGGAGEAGTIYSVNSHNDAKALVYAFKGGADGTHPNSLVYSNKILYGSTVTGGAQNFGTLFSIDTTTDVKTILYSFSAVNGTGLANPRDLIFQDGVLYGVVDSASAPAKGTAAVFKFGP